MPDKVVLDTCIIFAIYFKEEASSRAKRAALENDPSTVDLAFAETGNAAGNGLRYLARIEMQTGILFENASITSSRVLSYSHLTL